ncbi:MAG TPA: BON domain-containing protein [Deltaproteobacteria bacterium]|jgi:osmotically-inducible protein OsmY|nr:BON domain-containing protein [Deltaproteobacteria bacterium]HQI02555.1 BON domain-containing protein [Deltaproteobacteria bacterium]HQJ07714.1 BON domain-containing protein [Deltaproteobacteria bacterium]
MADERKRKPEDIRRDVYSQLAWDNRVGHTNILVKVTDDGTVILSGMVSSHNDRLEAEEDAYAVSGVKKVENRLTVSLPPEYPVPGDEDIAAQIVNLLQWNPTIDASRIEVVVTNGILTLMGSVDSVWQKYRVEHLAEDIAGVISVDNRLGVKPVGEVSDEDIRKDILATLARNSFIDASNISVSAKNGVVTLSGVVENHLAQSTAINIACNTNGVIDVHDNLEIAQ